MEKDARSIAQRQIGWGAPVKIKPGADENQIQSKRDLECSFSAVSTPIFTAKYAFLNICEIYKIQTLLHHSLFLLFQSSCRFNTQGRLTARRSDTTPHRPRTAGGQASGCPRAPPLKELRKGAPAYMNTGWVALGNELSL